ncbi:MAG: IS607 family transposase [Leptospirales bacterium]
MTEPSIPCNNVALYICLMNTDRRSDLEIRLNRLLKFANSQGWNAIRTVTEWVNSPMDPRPRLLELLSDPSAVKIVVECQEQLSQEGYPYIEAALHAHGRALVLLST